MFLLSALAIVPFYLWLSATEQFRTPKEILSVLLLLTLCHGVNKIKNIWLTLIPLWAFFVTAVFSYNWNGIPSVFFGWKEVFYIFLSCTAIRSIASVDDFSISYKRIVVNLKDIVRVVATVVVWVVIIQCLYALVQYAGFDRFFKAMSDFGTVAKTNTDPNFAPIHRMVGTVGNPSILATFLAFVAPMGLYLRNRIGHIAVAISLMVIALSHCTSAIIVFGISTLLYTILTYGLRWFLILFIAYFITSVGVIFTFHIDIMTYLNPLGRTHILSIAWGMMKDLSLTGAGCGMWEQTIGYNPNVLSQIYNQSWKEAHCEYFQILFTMGWVGLALFLCLVGETVVKFTKHITAESIVLFSCLVGFLVCCIPYFPMRVAPHSIYAVLFTGLLLRELKGEPNGR